jgi:hypothetical protein
MNEVSELWSSPWRTLQKDLATSFGVAGSNQRAGVRISLSVQADLMPTGSWLLRARSRKVRAFRTQ